MVVMSVIRKGDYRDSVVLMRVSKELEGFPGVTKASVMMGTSSNKELLKQAGILTRDAEAAGPNDLVIVAEAPDGSTATAAIAHAEKLLAEEVRAAEKEIAYKTVDAAVEGVTDANLVLISTPGEFAAREAMKALRAGKHVMIFSSDVPIEEEVKLKKFASERGLLVMGPDCGTAIVGGVGLGFSDVVRRGPVGIVGAAGTGIQEVSSLLDEVGITSAIGTGSHDLSDAVGGITMMSGLKALEEDENTKVIVMISKPPSPSVARKIMETVKGLKKPVVVNLIGGDPKMVVEAGAVPAKT
ncbi:MAG: FdrA family protein, partial [Candidatus Hadarchaeales archaeon]